LAKGQWLRTRPFETLASLAPQGEVLSSKQPNSMRILSNAVWLKRERAQRASKHAALGVLPDYTSSSANPADPCKSRKKFH